MSDEFVPPTPGPQHKQLEPFVGTFKAEVKMWFGPGDPMVTTGKMVSSWHLKGLYLHQDYAGDATDGPFPNFEGKGYWGYNSSSGKYEGFWIDSASPMMQFESGNVDESGKVWTMVCEVPNPHGEGTLMKESTISVIDENHHRMEVFFKSPNAEPMKQMEISYERA